MFNLNNSFFSNTPKISIPDSCKIVWVSDFFLEDLPGAGAELSSEALITSSPFEVFKLHSKDVSVDLLKEGQTKYWVFTNFTQMDYKLIPTIIANMKYSIIEYDFKYCKYRLKQLHMEAEKVACYCHNDIHGKLISSFFHGSKLLFWMSEKQRNEYFTFFPFLEENNNIVLSSIFDEKTMALIKLLRHKYKNNKEDVTLILNSNSWIKGVDDAKNYCDRKGYKYELISGLRYPDQLLEKVARSKRLVFLPKGYDSCARIAIEALLLGCETVFNENVIHKDEEAFSGKKLYEDGLDEEFGEEEAKFIRIEQYLYSCRDIFWNSIKNSIEYVPTLSSYTTTKDVISQAYPWRESIESVLRFSDEVVVLDSSTGVDDTLKELQEWAKKEPKLKVFHEDIDWNHPRSAVFDGQTKAMSKDHCTMDYCLQFDNDEVFSEKDDGKIRNILKEFPSYVDLIVLPSIECWGSWDKVRVDVNSWKARLMRNKKNITHGIPKELRKFDKEGNLYSQHGSDGCDFIFKDTLERVPYGHFMTQEVEDVRRLSLIGNKDALAQYQEYLNKIVDILPCSYHFSWKNLERKIKVYMSFWTRHWESLFNETIEDTVENNMFFDCCRKDVTEEMVKEKALELSEKTGGHIFHTKWKGQFSPSVKLNIPKDILNINF